METTEVITTSRTSSLKALLLKAWTERWTDLQWGIHIKSILPRGLSGDVYNLAGIILQQALVGIGPNEIVFSYLKHSLSSQLISHSAVLMRISKFEKFHKLYSVLCLLDFVESIQVSEGGITCRSHREENTLPDALLCFIYWLLRCHHHGLTNTPKSANVAKNSIILFEKLLKNSFIRCMLYLAKHEDSELSEKIAILSEQVEKALEEKPNEELSSIILYSMKTVRKLDISLEVKKFPIMREPVDCSMQSFLMIHILLFPTASTRVLVNQMRIIQRLKGYTDARLYCELLRSSLVNLNDAVKADDSSQWGAFTFIKIPHIIKEMVTNNALINSELSEESCKDVVECFKYLMEYRPLLNVLDMRTKSNNVEYLLAEMVNLSLLTEQDAVEITALRNHNLDPFYMVDNNQINNQQTGSSCVSKFMVRAHTALASVLRMVDLECNKVQEDVLLNIFWQLLNGKSFELILAVASVEGKLKVFVDKLIGCNESCSKVQPTNNKSVSRAKLFDTTFLILCCIVQKYGTKVILEGRKGETFFEEWVRDCMIERKSNKATLSLSKSSDPEKVSKLLQIFDAGEIDIGNPPMDWDEMCLTMPGVIREIHDRWKNSTFSSTDVKKMLDNIGSQMCCLAICSVSYLCSYMQILSQADLLKPRNMIQEFLTLLLNEENTSEANSNSPETQQDSSRERTWLMCHVIGQMQCDITIPIVPNKPFPSYRSYISSESLFKEILPRWEESLNLGFLKFNHSIFLNMVYSATDPDTFVKFMIQRLIVLKYQDQLEKSVGLLFGIFHLDIERCTLALLKHLPHLMSKPPPNPNLVEPQSIKLAKLIAYCIYATAQHCANSSITHTPANQDSDDSGPACKTMRLTTAEGDVPATPSIPVNTSPYAPIKGELLETLIGLFQVFETIANRVGIISQDTHFVVRMLEQFVLCGKESSRSVLMYMPNSLVPSLIKVVPNLFTMELILQLYDLNTIAGRKCVIRDLCLLRNITMRSSRKVIESTWYDF